MPYIKPKVLPYQRMSKLLNGYKLTGQRLADVLDVSLSTAHRRIKRPETLTLEELNRLNRFGHVPIDEIREAIVK